MGEHLAFCLKQVKDKVKMLALALGLALVSSANGNFLELGECPPKPSVVQSLDVERYIGDWYSQFFTSMPFGSEDITCSRSQYGIFEQGVNNISLFLSSNEPDGSLRLRVRMGSASESPQPE